MTVPSPPRLAAAMAAVALVAVLAALLGIGVRSTNGGQAAVDEPQYLLTAASLASDGDLDISDELAAGVHQPFHQAPLPVQSAVQPDGDRVSPHDPLLPAVLALPMALGGWVAAKAALALIAGALAALTVWVSVRRFGAPTVLAAVVTGVAAASAPLAVYGQQVYPELPAALAVLVAIACLSGRFGAAGTTGLLAAVVALPWLSGKYVPVAAVLALLGLVRLWRSRRRRAALVAGITLAVSGAAFLAVHRAVYGGWTAYASGDHFQDSGELGVVGFSPDFLGRSTRLVGLLVDRDFGLAAWQPAWLLAVPAVAALTRRRPPHWGALLAPLLVGWLVATFVALTMHGYWWPGRQVVVVLPLAVVAVAVWVGTLPPPARLVRPVAAVLGAAGVGVYAWVLAAGWAGRVTWVGLPDADLPVALALPRAVLPDYRELSTGTWALHAAWLTVMVLLLVAGWRTARPARPGDHAPAVPVDLQHDVSERTSRVPA